MPRRLVRPPELPVRASDVALSSHSLLGATGNLHQRMTSEKTNQKTIFSLNHRTQPGANHRGTQAKASNYTSGNEKDKLFFVSHTCCPTGQLSDHQEACSMFAISLAFQDRANCIIFNCGLFTRSSGNTYSTYSSQPDSLPCESKIGLFRLIRLGTSFVT